MSRMRFKMGTLSAVIAALMFSAASVSANTQLKKPVNREVGSPEERIATEELQEGIKSSDGRWFEIEMIIFEQTDGEALREIFDKKIKNLRPRRHWPLVGNYLSPDISQLLNSLPTCHTESDPLTKDPVLQPQTPQEFFQSFIDFEQLITKNWQFSAEPCLTPNEHLPLFWKLYTQTNARGYGITPYTDYQWQQTPTVIAHADFDDYHDVYLIAPQNLQLTDYVEQLNRQRNTQPLLHLGWRQPGLSERRSIPVYLYAGKNYSEEFYYDGYAKPPEPEIDETFVSDLEQTEFTDLQSNSESRQPQFPKESDYVRRFMEQLEAGAVVDSKKNKLIMPSNRQQFPDQTWQLDGYVNVHLNHYLFLNAEFNYRELAVENIDPSTYFEQDLIANVSQENKKETNDSKSFVVSKMSKDQNFGDNIEENQNLVEIKKLNIYDFKQDRRVYSGDIHYLDHPKIGILFQIRKYRH